MNKNAFTLAEVLITLGIIGVVAALTLPILIQNYRKQAVVTQLKKAYAEINQALTMAETEHGDHRNWEYGTAFDGESAKHFLDTYLAPYIKVLKNCGTDTGCLNGYVYSLDEAKMADFGNYDTNTAKVLLNSGYAIAITSGGTFVNVQIHLNSKKKDKDIMGKNVFMFDYGKNTKSLGSQYTLEELTTARYGCTKNGEYSSGLRCGEWIKYNGWEIPEDYPIKF